MCAWQRELVSRYPSIHPPRLVTNTDAHTLQISCLLGLRPLAIAMPNSLDWAATVLPFKIPNRSCETNPGDSRNSSDASHTRRRDFHGAATFQTTSLRRKLFL